MFKSIHIMTKTTAAGREFQMSTMLLVKNDFLALILQ